MKRTEMNTQDKSRKLAELAVFSTIEKDGITFCSLFGKWEEFDPYRDTEAGFAQAYALLLKFPEVMRSFVNSREEALCLADVEFTKTPTQANILDEILRMNGVEL